MFIQFDSHATDTLELGADALLYVMAHGHTISIPTAALYFAEKVAIVAIASRHTPAPVLRDVNKAIDVIAMSIRQRDRLAREAMPVAPIPVAVTPERPNEGPMARLQDRPTVRPPSGEKVQVNF
jgi:hypothetical protein